MNKKNGNKRPIGVWLISAFYSLSGFYSTLSLALVYLKLVPLNPAQQAYFASQSTFEITFSVVLGLLSLVGAILLFLMRKSSVNFFGASLIASSCSMVWNLLNSDFTEALGVPGLIGMVFGIGLHFGAFLYSRSLSQRGLLK